LIRGKACDRSDRKLKGRLSRLLGLCERLIASSAYLGIWGIGACSLLLLLLGLRLVLLLLGLALI